MIEQFVTQIIEKHDSNDPFLIAEEEKIRVVFTKLGGLSGLFTIRNGLKIILLNENLAKYQVKFVLAHELYHALVHSECINLFLNQKSFNLKGEMQANSFATKLLCFHTEMYEGMTKSQILQKNAIPEGMERYL